MDMEAISFAIRPGGKASTGAMITRSASECLARSRKSVVWMTGPAGSGKTTLAAQVCEQSGQPYVWLRAEARMADTGAFLSAFLAAFRKALPRETLPALASEDIAFPVDFLRRLIDIGSGGEPMLIVLDDLHVLPQEAAPLQMLAEARRDCADSVRIILVSREDPHPSWLWFNANGVLDHIGFETLRLDEGEAAALLGQPAIDAGWSGTTLLEASGGWILGARLLLQTATVPLPVNEPADRSEANGNLLDLIAQEIIAPLEERERRIILLAASLPNLSLSDLAHILDMPGAESLLKRLARQLLFVERDGRDRLQFHDILKAALKRRFPDAVSPEDVAAMLARAGSALIKRGEIGDGLALLSASGAWDLLRTAIITHAPAMKAAGELGIVLTALEPMPEEIREQSLALRYWHGVSLLSINPVRARILLSAALDTAKAIGEQELLIPIWSALVDAIWLEWIDCSLFDPLIAMLPELEPLAARLGTEYESMLARGAFAAMSFRCPDHPDFPGWEERNLDFYWQPMPRHDSIRRGIHLMFRYCLGEGGRWKVTQVRSRLNQIFDEEAAPVADICTRHVVSAEYLSIFEANGEETFRTVDQGLEANTRHQQTFWDGTLINAGLYKAVTLEDRERARTYLAQLAKRLGPNAHPQHIGFHEHFTAYCHWLDGEHQAALTHLMPAYRAGERNGMAIIPVHYGNGIAAILHAGGRRHEARSWMRKVRRAAIAQNSPFLTFLTHLRGAALALDSARPERALSYLRIALAAGASMRLYLHAWIRRSEMAALLRFAATSNIEKDYANELLRVLGLAGELPSEDWDRMQLITLGRFDVVEHGRSRLVSAKPQRSPIALAVHLVAAGPAGEAVETLADRLWPDADDAAGRKRMKSTVYRLRQMFGCAEAILTQGGRIALNPEKVAVDVWELQELATASGWSSEARYTEGLRLYTGPFVHHHADNTGLIGYGHKVELAVVSICTAFARSLVMAGDWQRAMRVARDGLDRIGYHEQLFDIAAEAAEYLGRQGELDDLSDMLVRD